MKSPAYMRMLISLPFVFAALFASAEMRTVTGYGTGDTLDQALIVAQSDAVLNAGGKIVASEQAQGDILFMDKGVTSNELFVSEYRILEKGESFDGITARIEAKVCDVSERKFDDGKYVIGEGDGVTERMARLAAIGNAISSLGIKIKAVGEYDKDVLVKDEAKTVGWAFVSDVEDMDSTYKNGKYTSKVKVKVFASKAKSGIDKNFSKEASGRGTSFFEAVNNARTKATFDVGSTYTVKADYEFGELVSRSIRHDWRGFCYGTEIIDKKQSGDTWDVNVRLGFDEDENSRLAGGVFSVSGFGAANNLEDAIEGARRDAVVNAGSAANISVAYDEGKGLVEQSQFKGLAYIGVKSTGVKSEGNAVFVQVDAKVSRDRERDHECARADSCAKGADMDAYRAYLSARFKSIVAAGALYDVERTYSGNAILKDTCSITSTRGKCGFLVVGFTNSGGGPRVVEVRTKGLATGVVVDDTVLGVGCGKTEDISFELAKNDAVVNARSKVAVKGKYDKTELKESEQLFVGKAFIGDVTVESAETCSAGRLVRIKASVSESQDGAMAVLPSRVDYDAKAASANAAIALARRGLLMKSGAMAKVRMMYKGMELTQSEAEYSASGTLSDCKMQVSFDPQGACSVHASGRIVESNSGHGEKKVEGFGCGLDFQAAKRAAVAYAILNCRGKISGEEKYEMGVFKAGNSVCDAEGFLFKTELVQCIREGDVYFVKVFCFFAGAEGLLSGVKEKVKSVGWGVDEDSAKVDAERNAIDSVFGRKIAATMAEDNGRITRNSNTEQGFGDGYVEDTKVEGAKTENGLYVVKIETVVRQRGVDDHGFSLGWVALCFILSGIIVIVVVGFGQWQQRKN